MKFFNFYISPFLRSSLLLSALLSMSLAADTTINESEQFFDESAVRSSSDTMRKKKKCKRPCNAQFNNVTACNTLVKKNLTVKGATNLNGQVNNNVGGTYIIKANGTGDLPTIQSGIDLVSSGLTPNENVTLSIQPGTYTETLFIQTTGTGIPYLNDPGTDLTSLVGRSLRIIGDTRPIAGMTYMLGGLLEADPVYCSAGAGNPPLIPASPLFNLGTKGSTITNITTTPISGGSNILTVVTSATPQPDFGACGITQGDIIILTDSDGTVYERSVLSATANTITYSGDPVTITDKGAALTFCPNVIVQNSNADAICFIANCTLEVIGIWFRVNTDPEVGSPIYGVNVSTKGALYCSQLLLDDRNSVINSSGLFSIVDNSLINTILADTNISGHISIIGGSAGLYFSSGGQSANDSSYFYIMNTYNFVGVWFNENAPAQFGILQMNGALNYATDQTALGMYIYQSSIICRRLNLFNCYTGIYGEGNAYLFIIGNTSLYNCGEGVYLDGGSQATILGNATFTIDSSPYAGIEVASGARFICPCGVTFNNMPAGSFQFISDVGSSIINSATDFRTGYPGPYANDAAAAADGVQIGGQYILSGSPLMVAILS